MSDSVRGDSRPTRENSYLWCSVTFSADSLHTHYRGFVAMASCVAVWMLSILDGASNPLVPLLIRLDFIVTIIRAV